MDDGLSLRFPERSSGDQGDTTKVDVAVGILMPAGGPFCLGLIPVTIRTGVGTPVLPVRELGYPTNTVPLMWGIASGTNLDTFLKEQLNPR